MKQKEIKENIFILLKNSESHQRELARILKTNQTNVRRALINLEKENIVENKLAGKSKIYYIKNSLEASVFEGIAEFYKLFKILEKPVIRKIYKEIQEKINSGAINPKTMIVLFGSYAKNLEKPKSDVDIYIDSNSKKEKNQIQEISNSINVSFGAFDKKNLLLKEIKKNHVVLNNINAWLNLAKRK